MRRLLAVVAALGVTVAVAALAQPDAEETSIWQFEVDLDTLGKYKVRATKFAIGDPVHETLTLHALIGGGIAKAGTTRKDATVVQYIRGVFWNDDPCAQLFANSDFQPLKASWGAAWYSDFKAAENDENPVKNFKGLSCPLLGRSHFGDLQFLHGMADRNGEAATVTAAKLLAWASVTYRIALGDIDPDEPLESDPTAKALLNSLSKQSFKELVLAKSAKEARERALGSLLHMIQDSYAHGHVMRLENAGPERGTIVQFLCYVDQNGTKHGHDDEWKKGTAEQGKTDLERTLALPGALNALEQSTQIVRLFAAGTPWADVEKYLTSGPIQLAPSGTKVSGPGSYQ